MTEKELLKALADDYNDLGFTYNGKLCGLVSTVDNSIPTFQAWCGEEIKEYKDIQTALNDIFFDGKSILDLMNKVDFEYI